MIVTISGAAGSGKSTIAKAIAKRFGLKHCSSGDFMGELAIKKGISLLELSKLAEKDESIDREIDNRQIKLGKEKDNFVIDSRLGFHFIPNSIKIFLDVSPEEGARRIFSDRNSRKDEKENITLEKTKENIKKRNESNKKRYMKYYGVDYFDKSNYDLVVDTTNLSAEETAKKLTDFIRLKMGKSKKGGRK